MTSIQLEANTEKYLISVDKTAVDKEWVLQLIQRLRTEELARSFDFNENIGMLGEQIKADWWSKNKHRFINE